MIPQNLSSNAGVISITILNQITCTGKACANKIVPDQNALKLFIVNKDHQLEFSKLRNSALK